MLANGEGERVPTLTWSSNASLISSFPSQISGYQLGKLLGKGAFGKVYETSFHGQSMALKIVSVADRLALLRLKKP